MLSKLSKSRLTDACGTALAASSDSYLSYPLLKPLMKKRYRCVWHPSNPVKWLFNTEGGAWSSWRASVGGRQRICDESHSPPWQGRSRPLSSEIHITWATSCHTTTFWLSGCKTGEELIAHQSSDCPFSSITCPHTGCNRMFSFRSTESHDKYVILACSNRSITTTLTEIVNSSLLHALSSVMSLCHVEWCSVIWIQVSGTGFTKAIPQLALKWFRLPHASHWVSIPRHWLFGWYCSMPNGQSSCWIHQPSHDSINESYLYPREVLPNNQHASETHLSFF